MAAAKKHKKNSKAGERELAQPGAAVLPVLVREGETLAQKSAQAVVSGGTANACVTLRFAQHSGIITGAELGELNTALEQCVERTKAGGTEQADELLTAQATTLNAIFLELARRASINMGQHLHATDLYLRLALKAQSQCRSTLESLAEIRNPRSVAFVKQANIAGGHQQVNNGIQAEQGAERAREGTERPPIELLENNGNVTRLDPRAQGASGRSNPPLEAVGAVYGATDDRGEGSRVA